MCRPVNFKATRLASVAALMMVALYLSAAQQTTQPSDNKVNMNDLIRDTQKSSSEHGEITSVIWMPGEYWEASLGGNSRLTPEAVKEFVTTINSYTIIAVVDGKIGALGGINYKPEAEIRSSLNIVDGGGQTYLPMDASVMDASAKNLLAIMKPMMANMLGPMGENMNFYLFPGKDDRGGRLFDPTKEGRFLVKLGEREFKWRLPLGSLLPAKTCPKCGETLSGAYKFCPWDGTPLPDKKDPLTSHIPGKQ